MAKNKVVKSKGGGYRAYARHRKELGLPGQSLQAVQNARDSGRITVVDGKIPDFELADQEWEQRTDPDAKIRRDSTPKPAPKPKSTTGKSRDVRKPSQLEVAKTKRESIRATREELELARLQGSLIPAEEVMAAQEARAAQEREALLNWPSRISGDLAAALKVPERTLFNHLDREVRKFLAERSSRLLKDAA